ncbi:E3 ubiquitin-protein ligase MIB2-like [Saccostrea cucullata]|uniref:E3 ubiquitin-protein ligase MIB2-like n=1 Tax=Saccostrea cuccullata TaxID=36930 RepID=UPI002ED60FEB
MKWSCCICDDIHLCTKCYMQGTHSLCHEFERKLYQKSKSIKVGIRNDDFEDKIFKYVKGIFPGAEVSLRNDEKAIGTVDKLTDKKIRMFNCDAFVRREIDNKDEVRYRVGREGHVDLKFLTPGKGLEYYEDHLQTISLDDAIPGMRVVAKNKTAEKEQVVGTIIMRESQSTRFYMPNLPGMVQESSGKVMKLKIQWDDGNIGNEIENDLQILLYDNSQIGMDILSLFEAYTQLSFPDQRV